MALTPREIALFCLRQAVPWQRALMPRQPAPLPKQSALTSRVLVPLSPRLPRQVGRQIMLNNPWGSPRGNSLEDPNPKWVINLSSKPLTQAQRSVLAKGPNLAVTPMHPPNLEYIMAIESLCTKLGQQDDEELRAEINKVLRSSQPPKANLTKAQPQAIRELKRERDHIVLTADKGVAMVIMDRQDYINKSNNLLNQPTYRAIPWYPTNTIKNKLINILKMTKNQTGLDSVTYKSVYPTGCVAPSSMGSPKSTNWMHTKAYCVQLWICHLWCG